MASRRTFSPIRTRALKRINKWSLGPKATPLAMTAGAAQIWTAGVVLLAETQVTLVRIRGDALLYLTAATATGDGFKGALGIAVVSNEAFTAGAAAIPDPRSVSESDWDGWIYHRFFHVNAVAGGSPDPAGGSGMQRIEIDSRAMRKWSNGYTIVGVLGTTEEGTAVGEFWADTRMLVKLS